MRTIELLVVRYVARIQRLGDRVYEEAQGYLLCSWCCFSLLFPSSVRRCVGRGSWWRSVFEGESSTFNDIADELRAVMLHLPLAQADLRLPVHSEVWATDATPTAAGATSDVVPQKIARALYRRSEVRGANVRLSSALDSPLSTDPNVHLLTPPAKRSMILF